MTEMKSILVNGKQYKIQTLSVLDTIDLHIDAMEAFGEVIGKIILMLGDIQTGTVPTKEEMTSIFRQMNSEKMKPFKKRILGQVVTPENKFLSDEVSIEDWFSKKENKEDVWEVLIKAMQELLGEYVPNFLRELTVQMMGKAPAEESKSPENTEVNPSSISQ